MNVLDIGCGTGLGLTLIDCNYIGVDKSLNMIKYCREKYRVGNFINCNAYNYIKNSKDKTNVISLFSLNYMNPNIINEIYKKLDKVFIAVHYNKPYKSSHSLYTNKKLFFYLLHAINKYKIKKLFKKYNAVTYKLLDLDYYYITILENGD